MREMRPQELIDRDGLQLETASRVLFAGLFPGLMIGFSLVSGFYLMSFSFHLLWSSAGGAVLLGTGGLLGAFAVWNWQRHSPLRNLMPYALALLWALTFFRAQSEIFICGILGGGLLALYPPRGRQRKAFAAGLMLAALFAGADDGRIFFLKSAAFVPVAAAAAFYSIRFKMRWRVLIFGLLLAGLWLSSGGRGAVPRGRQRMPGNALDALTATLLPATDKRVKILYIGEEFHLPNLLAAGGFEHVDSVQGVFRGGELPKFVRDGVYSCLLGDPESELGKLKGRQFDLIYCNLAVRHQPPARVRFYRYLREFLAPGGVLVVPFWEASLLREKGYKGLLPGSGGMSMAWSARPFERNPERLDLKLQKLQSIEDAYIDEPCSEHLFPTGVMPVLCEYTDSNLRRMPRMVESPPARSRTVIWAWIGGLALVYLALRLWLERGAGGSTAFAVFERQAAFALIFLTGWIQLEWLAFLHNIYGVAILAAAGLGLMAFVPSRKFGFLLGTCGMLAPWVMLCRNDGVSQFWLIVAALALSALATGAREGAMSVDEPATPAVNAFFGAGGTAAGAIVVTALTLYAPDAGAAAAAALALANFLWVLRPLGV